MQITHKASLALLAGIAFCPAAAQAQTLILGQSGSTTLSGTATTFRSGTTASGTYTYNPAGSTKPLGSQTKYAEWDAYGPSTANVNGGYISNLNLYNTSTVTFSGGNIDNLSAYDTSTTNLNGGIINANLDFYNSSTANVTAGSINEDLTTHDASTLNFRGGYLQGYLDIEGASIANVSGGNINSLDTLNTSTANVSGGTINTLETVDASTIDLFGTGFAQRFVSTFPTYTLYDVTGTLQDGTPINASYYDEGGTLKFTAATIAPEPSQLAALGLTVFGTLGLILQARRRSQTNDL